MRFLNETISISQIVGSRQILVVSHIANQVVEDVRMSRYIRLVLKLDLEKAYDCMD